MQPVLGYNRAGSLSGELPRHCRHFACDDM